MECFCAVEINKGVRLHLLGRYVETIRKTKSGYPLHVFNSNMGRFPWNRPRYVAVSIRGGVDFMDAVSRSVKLSRDAVGFGLGKHDLVCFGVEYTSNSRTVDLSSLGYGEVPLLEFTQLLNPEYLQDVAYDVTQLHATISTYEKQIAELQSRNDNIAVLQTEVARLSASNQFFRDLWERSSKRLHSGISEMARLVETVNSFVEVTVRTIVEDEARAIGILENRNNPLKLLSEHVKSMSDFEQEINLELARRRFFTLNETNVRALMDQIKMDDELLAVVREQLDQFDAMSTPFNQKERDLTGAEPPAIEEEVKVGPE